MRFQVVREWVRVEGREGVFLVVGIDRVRGIAGVIASENSIAVELVPLAAILPLDHQRSRYST